MIVWLKHAARMSISNLEPVISKCSRKLECVFARTYFSVCVCAENNARAQRKNQNEKPQATFHLGDSLLSIFVISLPTASLSFFTSSCARRLSLRKRNELLNSGELFAYIFDQRFLT